MRSTIDSAGRVVIPKSIRERVGLRAGEVDIDVDGAGVRIEPVTTDDFEDAGGWLVIPASGGRVTTDDARSLRDVDQK